MNTDSPEQIAKSKLETLFGGRAATALQEDGTALEIRVRQIRLSEYEDAFKLLPDELAFTAFCCSLLTSPSVPLKKEWAVTLQPDSYEDIQLAVEETNKGFFAFAGRRQIKAQKEQERMAAVLAGMTPEAIETLTRLGNSTLRMQSPTPRPRPG